MSNLMTALSLASSGLHVFPCKGVNGDEGKVPLVSWRGDSTTDTDKIARWWQRWPDATVGLDVGKSGLVVVDADKPKPDKGIPVDGTEWFESVVVENGADSFPFVRSLTPSGGVHYIFRQPADGEPLRNARGSLPKKAACNVDVRGVGGYILAPGSNMQDGRAYVLDGNIADVPPLPDWLLKILRAPEPAAEPTPPAGLPMVVVPPSPGRVGAYSHAGFETEVNEVRTAPKGARNETLNTSAFKIGTMVGAGWITESEATAALTSAVAGWADQRKTLDTLRRGLQEGMRKPREGLPPEEAVDHAALVAPLLARSAAGDLYDKETGEVVEAAPLAPPVIDGYPVGLVGELARWIVACARQPQPLLALGAALAIVGTVIGRKVAGPTLSGTHLYVVGLADTGTGKDRPLASCNRVLYAAGLDQRVGGSEFISMPAVINAVSRSPASLWAMDEFGAFLKRINNRHASGFEQAITKAMRSFWGSSFETFTTPEWASKERVKVEAPALSIFAVSTVEDFYEALSGGDIANGVLNRLLVLSVTGDKPADREPLADHREVPSSIIEQIKALTNIRGEVAAAGDNSSSIAPEPVILTWGPGALDAWNALGDAIVERIKASPDDKPFLARTKEYAVRIATIVAAGRGSATVDLADMEFGRDLAWRSACDVISGADGYMADTENQMNANIMLRAVRGRAPMSHATLTRALKNRLRHREFNDLLAQLVASGQLLLDKDAGLYSEGV